MANLLGLLETDIYGDVQRAVFVSNQSPGQWYAQTKLPVTDRQQTDLAAWDTPPMRIDPFILAPLFDPRMTLADTEENVYTKEIDVLDMGMRMFKRPYLCEIMRREIETCEALSQHPHPNVCGYKGVRVENGFATGLVFEHFKGDLVDLVEEKLPFDIEKCLGDIQEGLAHIHSLGFVHCDVKPENIFVDYENQRFVVGDFDATHREGGLLTLKCGDRDWVPPEEYTAGIARQEIDTYSLEKVRTWLEQKDNPNPAEDGVSNEEQS